MLRTGASDLPSSGHFTPDRDWQVLRGSANRPLGRSTSVDTIEQIPAAPP